MEIRQLITFSKIIELQSFSKAAQALGYSQSAVTVQIRLLEEELGVRLFDRIAKRTHLTPKGEEFRTYAYRILHETEAAKQKLNASETPSGTLRIGAIDTICAAKLPQLLHRFSSCCPRAAIHVTPGSPETLFEMLEKNQVDLIYILDDPRYSNDWHKALEAREEIIFVSTPHFMEGLHSGDPLPSAFRIEELLSYPFLLTEKGENYRLAFDRYLAAKKLIIRPFLETSNTEVLLRTLEETGGISLLPRYYAAKGIAEGRITAINIEGFHAVMYRQIFYHKDKWVTPEMEAFIRIAAAP